MENKKKVKKIWNSKEWRELRKKRIRSKCEKCNSIDTLAIHHETSFGKFLVFNTRKLIITRICEVIEATFSNSEITKKGGFTSSKGYVGANDFKQFLENNPGIRDEAEELAKKDYLSSEDWITLCNRCHFAIHNGLTLCGYCKKRYYRKGFLKSCSSCRESVENYKQKR